MASWEPAVDVLVKLATLKEVADLVAMPHNVSASLFAALGATEDEHPSVLGMMDAEEIAAEISGLKIEQKDPNIIQKGHIRKMIHLCRLIAGTFPTLETQKDMEDRLSKAVNDVTKIADETRALSATHSAPPSGPQVPLKHVVSQGSEESVPKISNDDVTRHWDQFDLVCGRDPRPEEGCTVDQLTGVDTFSKRDCAPYVDFGVWSEPPSSAQKVEEHRITVARRRCSSQF